MDSCISLCTGNLNFFTDSYKAFPCIVERIVIAKSDNFALISLSSIVREDNKEVTTTELHVLYILRMPYTLRLGGPVHLQVACGKDMSVIFAIGNTFPKCALATLSHATHTLRCKTLSKNCMLPLVYKVPTLSVLDVAPVQWVNLARNVEVIENLNQISTVLVTDLGPITGKSGGHGQALKTSLRSGRYIDD